MIRFSWSARRVTDKIHDIQNRSMRAAAREAYGFLKESRDSSYWHFHERHLEFLRRHDEPTDRQRERSPFFIEEVGLECAVWPHLYWRTDMCESHARSMHDGRLAQPGNREEPGADDEEEPDPQGVHSMKRNYLTKVFSRLKGYGSTAELVQYVYDLNLWTTVGAKKNKVSGVPLRILLKSQSFSPMYWKNILYGLIDLVRQIGPPTFFWTVSPFEWSFPYHLI